MSRIAAGFMTEAEQRALLDAAAAANGQILVTTNRVAFGDIKSVSPIVAQGLVGCGYLDRINESWCGITDRGRAEAEWLEEQRLQVAVRRDQRRARRRAVRA